jgi:hypothetical protein
LMSATIAISPALAAAARAHRPAMRSTRQHCPEA